MWSLGFRPSASLGKRISCSAVLGRMLCVTFTLVALVAFAGCAESSGKGDHPNVVRVEASDQVSPDAAEQSLSSASDEPASSAALPVSDIVQSQSSSSAPASASASASAIASSSDSSSVAAADNKEQAKKLFKKLGIKRDLRESFVHGKKPAKYQKYIVLHDTEGDGSAEGVIEYWDGSDAGVAAHFVINKDGSIVQCVKLDQIAHHAGYGDTGHNKKYGVEDESRDDKEGTVEIGSDFADYGMNSYSIGIEMVHVGGSGDYPKKQLEALDGLIAYIDTYYGKESKIIDHKAWRSGNSDTSEEFADYLKNYQDHRSYKDVSSKSS